MGHHPNFKKGVNHNNNSIQKYHNVVTDDSSRPSSRSSVDSCGITMRKRSVLDRRRGLVYSGLFMLCVSVYWNSLGCEFVFDDITAIVENRDLRPHVPLKNLFQNDFWGTPMSKEQSHKSYRPLTVLTFRLNYLFGETEPLGYHLVNVVLHGLVTALFFKVCRLLTGSAITSLVASILFSLHPIHTEAVTGVVGRAELLASLFFLMAILAYSKAAKGGFPRRTNWLYLMTTLMAATAAMLCKEQGITVFAVCVVYEVCYMHKMTLGNLWASAINHRRHWLSHALQRVTILALGCIGLLLLRLRLMGATLPVFTRFDNPAAASSAPTKQLTFAYLASFNLWLLLAPCDLICDWTMNTVPLVTSGLDPRNLASLALVSGLAVFAKHVLSSSLHKASAVCSMALAMTVFPFIPASNLFFPVGFVVAERVLYLPSMGFCLLVALGWQRLQAHGGHRKAANFGLGALCMVFALRTIARNGDWQNELSIFTSGLKVTRSNAKLLNNVGHALESKADYGTALQYFQKAIQVQPDDIGGHINVGRIYNHMKRFKEAEEAYLRAKALLPKSRPGESYQARVAPNHLNVFLNLATLIAKNGSRLEEADLLYRQAISMRSDYTQAYINRGDILLRLNRTQEAKEVYEQALGFENDNPDLLYNMGVVLLSQGQHNEAMAYLNKALEYDPDHYQALLNSAILIQESGSSHLNHVARERLLRIVRKGKSNERVFFNLGMLAMDAKDQSGAEQWFRKAVEVKPDFRSALFNLALLLSESDRPLEAEPFLRQLLHYYPEHVKGLILLGDLYVNHRGDLRAAEKCYRLILRIEANNVQAQHNLCVIMVEAGDLANARECLERVADLAPNEAYISKHLRIVEEKLEQKLLQISTSSSVTPPD